MTYTILNHSLIRDEIASVHRTGCRDIRRESREHGSSLHVVEATDGEDAADLWIDDEMVDLGYTVRDVKVHPCCGRTVTR